MKTNNLYNFLNLVQKMISYNLRIIFANKFIWFLAGSVVFYLGLSVIYVFDKDVSNMRDLYGVFLFSGILLVFYPTAFGIQNDQDARTIEILFGIPNYRYKVWLVRIVPDLRNRLPYHAGIYISLFCSYCEIQFCEYDSTGNVSCSVSRNHGIYALNSYKKWKWHSSYDDNLRTHLPDTERLS